MITQSITDFNRAAAECSAHRMKMVSSEEVWASAIEERLHSQPGDGHDPVKTVITFECSGSCKQKRVIEYKN